MTDENQFKRVQWTDDEYQMSDDDGPDGIPLRPPGAGLSDEDLELLTLAARALGATVEAVEGEQWVNLRFEDSPPAFGWNPLRHSDDAFNLGVRLGILEQAAAEVGLSGNQVGDEYANARHSVTCLAAEIGKAMQPVSAR